MTKRCLNPEQFRALPRSRSDEGDARQITVTRNLAAPGLASPWGR
jgi:hypothetical protein